MTYWEDYDGKSEKDARTDTYRQLLWFALHKGYKPGWAACKFHAIYGVWPNGEAVDPVLEPLGEWLGWWINQQNAAYATMKRKERIVKENESRLL
jgi:hypothetical protein